MKGKWQEGGGEPSNYTSTGGVQACPMETFPSATSYTEPICISTYYWSQIPYDMSELGIIW
jgi:hypothetical protein